MDWKKKINQKYNAEVKHMPIYFWQEGLLEEIYASRAHSTFVALAILANLQPKQKR